MNELTITENDELTRSEYVIENGLKVFADVGEALLSIRDKRLYRRRHNTFEDYCRDRWQIKRSYAYELIVAASTAKNISMSGIPDMEAPGTVSQIRPLTKLTPEEQPAAWMKALETLPPGEKMTAAHVQKTVNAYSAVTDIPLRAPVPLPTWALDEPEGEDENLPDCSTCRYWKPDSRTDQFFCLSLERIYDFHGDNMPCEGKKYAENQLGYCECCGQQLP